MGPTWGPPGSCRSQMGPMLAPRTSFLREGFSGPMYFSGWIKIWKKAPTTISANNLRFTIVVEVIAVHLEFLYWKQIITLVAVKSWYEKLMHHLVFFLMKIGILPLDENYVNVLKSLTCNIDIAAKTKPNWKMCANLSIFYGLLRHSGFLPHRLGWQFIPNISPSPCAVGKIPALNDLQA